MPEDGEIIINTKIDNSKLGKQIKNLQEKIEKEQLELEIKFGEKEETKEEANYLAYVTKKIREEQQENLKLLEEKKEQYQAINELIKSGEATKQDYDRYKFLEEDITKLEEKQQELNNTYDSFNNKLNKATDNLTKSEAKYEAQEKKVKSLKENLGELIQTYNEQNAFNISNLTDRMSKGITKIIKNIGRWTLAVFGIRSAYMAVRSAMSTIAGQDDQLKADIDYMRNAVAFALEPIVRKIVEWMKMLLYYVAYIIKLVTGRNIFENANKSLQSANKNAKDLKKTLAGFDEMNVLSDGSNGTSDGNISPSIDLTNLDNINLDGIEGLSKKIKNIFDKLFKKIIQGFIKTFKKIGASDSAIGWFAISVNGIKEIIEGLYDFIVGIFDIIIGVFKGDTELVKKGFVKLAEGIKKVIQGIWDFIIGTFNSLPQTIGDIWKNLRKLVVDITKEMMEKVSEKIKNGINSMNDWFGELPSKISNVADKIKDLFKDIGTSVGTIIGTAFKKVINGVIKAIEDVLNFPIESINFLIGGVNDIFGTRIKKLPTFHLPRLAKGGILNMPGKGINYGVANVAERGPEGVIPLTDSQQMALLGEAIGKYININATIPVYVANRQIAKEIRRINAEDDFAFNR